MMHTFGVRQSWPSKGLAVSGDDAPTRRLLLTHQHDMHVCWCSTRLMLQQQGMRSRHCRQHTARPSSRRQRSSLLLMQVRDSCLLSQAWIHSIGTLRSAPTAASMTRCQYGRLTSPGDAWGIQAQDC